MLRLRSNLILNLNMKSSNSTGDPQSLHEILKSSTAVLVGYPLKSNSLFHREKQISNSKLFLWHIYKKCSLQKNWVENIKPGRGSV